ncbi:Peptidase S8 propeptide/proteinase inhibitor I9 [Dillenia turbinata]|uniref:Peptidase S8 propeptide/proteinase inhibitor I9 n=1 Tax=Dillenia turbinata TaxID=194707 RepID=A0AAN8ZIM0_9MAGN
MKKSKRMILFIFHLFIVASLTHGSKEKERKPYIVYMGEVPKTTTMSATVNAHHRLLSHAIRNAAMLDVFSEKTARESRIHSFGRSFNGFVARLLPHEARRLKESKKVISVFPNTRHQLHTTRSWDFLGMHTTAKHGRISAAESDIIMGFLDTGHRTVGPDFIFEEFGSNLPVLMTKDLGHHLPNGKANVLLKGILPDATRSNILVGREILSTRIDPKTECTLLLAEKKHPMAQAGEDFLILENRICSACDYGTLSMNKVKGKIVFCLGNSGQDYTVAELGGIGTIVTSDEETDIAFTMVLPGTVVRSSIGKKIGEYINSSKEPQAVIYSTTTAPMDAPFVASFSSRATPMKKQSPDAELGSGAGQINPKKAVDPGLVYDLSMSSYIMFLCKERYNTTTLQLLIGGKKHYNCSNFKPAQGIDGLNYPTFHLQLKCLDSPISAEFHRTVTHVGQGKSVYNAKVTSSKNLTVTVVPNTLTFDKPRQRRSFKVLLEGPPMAEDNNILSASLEWSDSKHSVRSPIKDLDGSKLIVRRLPSLEQCLQILKENQISRRKPKDHPFTFKDLVTSMAQANSPQIAQPQAISADPERKPNFKNKTEGPSIHSAVCTKWTAMDVLKPRQFFPPPPGLCCCHSIRLLS